jgi:hypothetical protein
MSLFTLHALRPLGLIGVGVLATLGALSLTHLGPVQASASPGVNLAALVARLNADEAKIASQATAIASQATAIAQLKGTPVPGPQGLKGDTGAQGVKGDTGATGAGFTPAKIAILNAMALSSDPSAGGTNTLLTITGINVQIVNGLGSTETQNGLGNLTVGYNELRGNGTDSRMGSHNIITGIYNNYASSGGIVGGYGNSLNGREEFAVGESNTASGPYASVSGGVGNTASGYNSSVSGGYGNTASGDLSSVSGGSGNTASGPYASVSGGYFNTASGLASSVSGGFGNTASGSIASVSGGYRNTASGNQASVSGGEYNTASGDGSSVSGGSGNTASGDLSSVSGGFGLTQNNTNGWTGGGYHSP